MIKEADHRAKRHINEIVLKNQCFAVQLNRDLISILDQNTMANMFQQYHRHCMPYAPENVAKHISPNSTTQSESPNKSIYQLQ